MVTIIQIALNTYRETVRSKALFSVFFFAILLVVVSSIFGSVTIGEQSKVVKDFGLMSITLFSVAVSVLSGSALLFKELNRKTIYNILAKPVQRWQFLVGKHLGLMFTVIVMVGLMASGLMLFAVFFDGHLDFLILVAAAYILLEMIIIVAAAIFFSSIVVTPVLSGLFTFCVFVAGRSSEHLMIWADQIQASLSKQVLTILYWILPHLSSMNVSNETVYGKTLGWEHFVLSFGYSLGYAASLILIANLFFMRREFD